MLIIQPSVDLDSVKQLAAGEVQVPKGGPHGGAGGLEGEGVYAGVFPALLAPGDTDEDDGVETANITHKLNGTSVVGRNHDLEEGEEYSVRSCCVWDQ